MDEYGPPEIISESSDGSLAEGKQKPFPFKILVGFLVGLVVLVVGVLAILFQSSSAPREAADQFLAQVKADELDAAYGLTSGEFQAAVASADFRRLPEAFPILVDFTDYSFNSFSITGDEAIFSGQINGPGGQSEPLTVTLVKEEGQWRVWQLSLRPEDVLELEEIDFE